MCKEFIQKDKKLAEFEVNGKRYAVYGDYAIEYGKDTEQNAYPYPEFDSLTAKTIEDGTEKDFVPSGATWTGHRYDVSDMIQDFLAKQIIYNGLYKAVYVEEGLQELIDWFHREIALISNNLQIPKRILYNDMYDLYELELVTSEFIYYMYDEHCLMLRTDNHDVVSDNYFASEGFMASVENIGEELSEEKFLWGINIQALHKYNPEL